MNIDCVDVEAMAAVHICQSAEELQSASYTLTTVKGD
jgi:hypothetical protein